MEHSPDDIVEADVHSGLASFPVLSDATPEMISELEQACRWIRVKPNVLLMRHDDMHDNVAYFLITGTVRVFFPVKRRDRDVNFAELGPGAVFGELAAIDRRGRSADIETMTECVLAACPEDIFIEALQIIPGMSFRLLVKFAGIIRESDRHITRLAALSAVQRVYLELLRLALPDISGNGSWVISPAPLHKDIANWAGTTTDVVGRAIGQLMRGGLLQRRGPLLHIPDRGRVEALARVAEPDDLEI